MLLLDTRRKERKKIICFLIGFICYFPLNLCSKFTKRIKLNWFRCGAWVASEKLIYIYSMLFVFTSLIVWNVIFFYFGQKFWSECVWTVKLLMVLTLEWQSKIDYVTKKAYTLTDAHFVAGTNQCQARDKIKAFHYLWHFFSFVSIRFFHSSDCT